MATALTNVKMVNTKYSFASGAACGASFLVSIALSSPAMNIFEAGRITTFIHNPSSNIPLHVEHRSMFTDVCGVSLVIPLIAYLTSTTQAYGGSAGEGHSLILLISGQHGAIPIDGIVGSALHIVIMPASGNICAISGVLAVWGR